MSNGRRLAGVRAQVLTQAGRVVAHTDPLAWASARAERVFAGDRLDAKSIATELLVSMGRRVRALGPPAAARCLDHVMLVWSAPI